MITYEDLAGMPRYKVGDDVSYPDYGIGKIMIIMPISSLYEVGFNLGTPQESFHYISFKDYRLVPGESEDDKAFRLKMEKLGFKHDRQPFVLNEHIGFVSPKQPSY